MVSLALSVVVVSSMVALMGNSLGSATRVIQMTQLSDELRNTMSMLTRDVRRANYNPYSLRCYANADCGIDDASVTHSPELLAVQYSGNTCLRYYLERAEPDGTPSPLSGGAFRHVVSGDVGSLEMWVGGDEIAPDAGCGGDASLWVPITDSSFVNITNFDVTPVVITGSLQEEGGGKIINQQTRRVQVRIEGRLIIDSSISRQIADTVRVRNDFLEIVNL